MRKYRHKTLGVIIEVESVIGGEWEELTPPVKEEPKEETPKRRPKRKG